MHNHYDDVGRLTHVEVYAYELRDGSLDVRGLVMHGDGSTSVELAPGRLTPLVILPNPIPQPDAGRRLFARALTTYHPRLALDTFGALAAYRAVFPRDGAHLYR